MSHTVIICDDHKMFSEMLGEFVEATGDFTVPHIQETTAGLKEVARQHQADLILSDMMLPGPPIFDVLPEIMKDMPEVRVVVMSGMFNTDNTTRLYHLGIHGIVSKLESSDAILTALRTVLSGRIHYPEELLAHIQSKDFESLPKVSDREIEVISLIAKGMSEKQIADVLSLSDKTINNHKAKLFQKLKVQNQVELVVLAIRLGLIANPSVQTPEGGESS